MKLFLSACASMLIAIPAFATATLRIPVFIEGDDQPVAAAEINQKLRAAGAALLPDFIEIRSDEDGYQKMKSLDKVIATSLRALGPDYEYVMRAFELVPGENNRGDLVTCYIGEATEIPGIVTGLTDVAYSDQLNMWGWKYREQQWVDDGNSEAEVAPYLDKKSTLWKDWSGKSDDLLILSAVGDDGTDVNESLIPPCR